MRRFLPPIVPSGEPVTLTGQAYRAIRLALISGYFRPGDRLTMRGLAEQLEMSVTPVREAIQLLITEHALIMPGPKTVTVPRIDTAQYNEIILIRCALEALAAEQAIGRLDTAAIDHLRQVNVRHREAIEVGDVTAVLTHNRQFHFSIYQPCAMPSLIDLIENQWVRIGPLLNLLYPHYMRSLSGNRLHDRMIAAIEDRDAGALTMALRDDLSLAQIELTKVLQPAA